MTNEWNSLDDEGKGPFRQQTEVQKKRYEEEMKVYRAKKAAETPTIVKLSSDATAAASATAKKET
jgi:hypothetical protein